MLFSCYGVSAKTLENTCVYEASYEKKEENKKITITCKFYDNNTYDKCDIGTTFKQSISNWSSMPKAEDNMKSWYEKNHKCFPYFVFMDKGTLFDKYEIYAADTLTRANSLKTEQGDTWDYHTAIATEHSLYEKEDKTKEPTDKINSYIETLNDIENNFGLKDCVTNGKIEVNIKKNNYKVCQKKVEAMYEQIKEYDQYTEEQIKNGTFKEEDPIITQYREAVSKARGSVNETLDENMSQTQTDEKINVTASENNNLTTSDINCNNIFSGNFGKYLKLILSFIRFLVPIIILGLAILDFIKATSAQDETEMKKASTKLVQRMIIGVIIFLLPTLLEVILNLADIPYGTCGIK